MKLCMAKQTPEKQIENQILQWMHLFPNKIFAWKNNTTGVFDPNKHVFRTLTGFSITGVSDILGIIKPGHMVAIEVKTPQSIKQWLKFNEQGFQPTSSQVKAWKRAREQKAFLDRVESMGGVAGVAASLDDAQILLDDFLRD